MSRFHPDPAFFETMYSDIPLEQFFFEELEAGSSSLSPESLRGEERILSASELETYIDDLLDQPDLETTPPDALVFITYRWTSGDLNQVKALVFNLPAVVLHAK